MFCITHLFNYCAHFQSIEITFIHIMIARTTCTCETLAGYHDLWLFILVYLNLCTSCTCMYELIYIMNFRIQFKSLSKEVYIACLSFINKELLFETWIWTIFQLECQISPRTLRKSRPWPTVTTACFCLVRAFSGRLRGCCRSSSSQWTGYVGRWSKKWQPRPLNSGPQYVVRKVITIVCIQCQL